VNARLALSTLPIQSRSATIGPFRRRARSRRTSEPRTFMARTSAARAAMPSPPLLRKFELSSSSLGVLGLQVSGSHDSGRNVPIQLEDCRGHATPELRAPHEAASASAPPLLFKPEPNRPWSIQLRRKVDDLSFVLNLLVTVTLMGLPLLAPRDNARTHVREQPGDMMPVREGSSVARTSPALVVTARQRSYVNELLPLGMWLNDASGKETVTVAGLAEGTELSLGTSRGLAGWVLSGRDLDKTFIAPPRDFVGVMNATVKLSSGAEASCQLERLASMPK
jgi:hypothetical protein